MPDCDAVTDDPRMTAKRKLTYEQDQALVRGRDVARANQRRRVAQREQQEREQRAAATAAANHVHAWRNWEYVMGYTHEVRECRECGYAEMRPVAL